MMSLKNYYTCKIVFNEISKFYNTFGGFYQVNNDNIKAGASSKT